MYKYRKFILCLGFIFLCFLLISITATVTLKYYKESISNITMCVEKREPQNINCVGPILFEEYLIPNEELTRKYADFILGNVLNENCAEYSKLIEFDEEGKIWSISYIPLGDETLGGSIDILISAENGEVVNIIYGE